MRDHVSEGLFSLFTSSDRAEALAGDLMEEREKHGWAWFWLHVVRVALTLWRNATADAPLRVVALTMAGCAFFIAPAIGGAAAVRLFPNMGLISWIALLFFWWGGALLIGTSLVAIAPRRGMAACATLAVIGEGLMIASGVSVLWQDLQSEVVLYYAIALATAAPLLLGGAIARRRLIACGIPIILLAIAQPALPQHAEWKDPSPHRTTLVTVENDVRLEGRKRARPLDAGASRP